MSTPPLRPMTLGEIFDRTFQIYRARFWAFVSIAAVPAVAMMAVRLAESAWLSYHPLHGRILAFYKTDSALAWTLVLMLVGGFCQLSARPVFLEVTASCLGGVPCTVLQALANLRCKWKNLLLLNIFEQVVVILVPGGMFLLGAYVCHAAFRAPSDAARASLLPGLFILLWAAVMVSLYVATGIRFALSFPALQFEGSSWFAAVKRSWSLSKGRWGRIFLLWGAVVFSAWAASATLGWVAFLTLRALAPPWFSWGHWFPYLAAYELTNVLISVLIGPVYPIALTLLYYDQRIRREGYDIEWMMRAAGLHGPEAQPPALAATAGPSPLSAHTGDQLV